MKKACFKALTAAGIIVSLLLIVWPVISNVLYRRQQTVILNNYSESVREKDDLTDELEACRQYNRRLFDERAAVLGSIQDTVIDMDEYEDRLAGNGDGVMGYVEIPKINVMLPIYHYTASESLDSGAGHMPETSLPTGGSGTHAGISAHTGSAKRALFSDLDLLDDGDVFYIHVLDEVHAYRVDRILTVLPHETSYLELEENKDWVTLITCTPFGVNSHRLLVRGTRDMDEEVLLIDEESEQGLKSDLITVKEEAKWYESTWMQQYLKAIAVGSIMVVAAGALAIVSRILGRKRRET